MPIAPEVVRVVEIPEGVEVRKEGDTLIVKGPLGELRRTFTHRKVRLELEDGRVVIRCPLPRRKEAAVAGTWEAHVRNMVKGVTQGFTYIMHVRYSHFPIKVTVKGRKVVIENFLGEKAPRYAEIVGDTKVEVERVQLKGPEGGRMTVLKVFSIDKEAAGQTAANIERATRIKDKDVRVFQDGIYIAQKPR
ncbi:MAG: 50S ribosomal protein L6 [Thermoplasmata archaeon]|nr:MAG: 50S ribosomal protein L6 [Thermoplasmata archaeon]HDJ27297.1 50S ribosomal protein L6 [Aciduliprofundum sp.]